MCAADGAAGGARSIRPSLRFVSFSLAAWHDIHEFAARGLLQFEAVGGKVGVQHDFGDLQIEAIVVMRAIDADVMRERRNWAAYRSAGLWRIDWLPIGIAHVGHQQALWRECLEPRNLQIG